MSVIREIRKLREEGNTFVMIAKKFNISEKTASMIANKTRRGDVQ